ncbi:hepatocyte growth factor-regulated tyrosine kinase substrate-like [Rhinopithecus roxellana]|uniref:hepatocyte growth factor-regulated tyrosine kinase substrate-like n=1 Tax=Rhinopithecus roxellana TaxID=61622 RepID=UPI0012379DA8|nr:hepatocyte growth factor-regulated tyrosine kinase substrate-like [Rhinopithecus roxellana]
MGRRGSPKAHSCPTPLNPQLQSEELGLRAPQWVRDKMVTMCMRCQEPFNALTRRRHHCRACGYVVCARCSDYRAELKYNDNRPNRVCLHCYTFLTGNGNALPEAKEDKRRGILEVRATVPTLTIRPLFRECVPSNHPGLTLSNAEEQASRGHTPLLSLLLSLPTDPRSLPTAQAVRGLSPNGGTLWLQAVVHILLRFLYVPIQ